MKNNKEFIFIDCLSHPRPYLETFYINYLHNPYHSPKINVPNFEAILDFIYSPTFYI